MLKSHAAYLVTEIDLVLDIYFLLTNGMRFVWVVALLLTSKGILFSAFAEDLHYV